MLNDEEILELCLTCVSNDMNQMDNYPGRYIAEYILESEDGASLTDEELKNKVNDLITAHDLKRLTDLGLLDVSFDESGQTSYSPSEFCNISLYLDLYYEGLEISQDMEKIWNRLSEEEKEKIKIELLKE